eukprot:TRINITY_DN3038_c0_g2_i3.p1 TRINITY_DN3038_c0_g2~~TRINITY_DN3038_c0_g2_i3.p1  ORF type:complete len:330 (+),score=92.89 TRINITY_DN3038_c0_g2_i3:94-1083(+)
MDSIIDDISNIILSRSQITDEDDSFRGEDIDILGSDLGIVPSPNKKPAPKSSPKKSQQKKSPSKSTKKPLKNLESSNKVNSYGTKSSSTTNTSVTVERLMEYKKKAQKRLADKMKEKEEQVQEEMTTKPQISTGSLKLIEGRQHLPIYSAERIKQIEQEKTKRMEKLRKEAEERKRRAEEEDIANSTPSYRGSEITNVKLCFDPESIKPMVYQPAKAFANSKPSTEDEELKSCSFKPATDKNSNLMFARKNQHNKSVVERLTSSGKRKEESKQTFATEQKKGQMERVLEAEEGNDLDKFVQSVLEQLAKPDDAESESPACSSVMNKYIT